MPRLQEDLSIVLHHALKICKFPGPEAEIPRQSH
jgi:hypothetical protein